MHSSVSSCQLPVCLCNRSVPTNRPIAYGLCPRGKIRQTLGGLGFVLRIINQQIHYGLRTHAMKYQHKKVPRRAFFSSQRCYSVCVSSCIFFLGGPTAMAVVATKSRLEAMSRAVLLFSISQALLSQTCRSLGLEKMPLSCCNVFIV